MTRFGLGATLAAVLLVGGCSTTWDPHAPRTIEAAAEGGDVTVKHGQRLHIPLGAGEGYEWNRVEPQILTVVEHPPRSSSTISRRLMRPPA